MLWLRNLAEMWADGLYIKTNDVLRRKLVHAEAANERLTQTVDRLRLRRALERDVRVRAEVSVGELTRANLKLSGLLAERLARPEATVDPDAVERALKTRAEAGKSYVRALTAYLEADAAYRNRYNAAYIDEGGPEHLRKAVAESAAAGLRSVRDAAEGAKATAEQELRDAELGWRSAMAGAAPPEAGE